VGAAPNLGAAKRTFEAGFAQKIDEISPRFFHRFVDYKSVKRRNAQFCVKFFLLFISLPRFRAKPEENLEF